MSVLLSALLLVSADPTATPSQVTSLAPAAAPVKVAEKKICRVDTDDSTSRLRRRVCLTQNEWDKKNGGVLPNDLKNMGAR